MGNYFQLLSNRYRVLVQDDEKVVEMVSSDSYTTT